MVGDSKAGAAARAGEVEGAGLCVSCTTLGGVRTGGAGSEARSWPGTV